MRRIHTVAIAGALLALGCGAETETPKPSGGAMSAAPVQPAADADEAVANRLPVVRELRMSPTSPVPGGEVSVEFQVHDPDGDSVRPQIVWKVDGRVIDRGEHRQIALGNERKGAVIEVEVSAFDGQGEGAPQRARVSIGNQISSVDAVYLEPREVWGGIEVQAKPQGSDPDGDRLTFEFQWSVDGKVVARGDTFDTTGLRRGDEIDLAIRATDGETPSPWSHTRIPVLNAPPMLPENPQFTANGGTFQHQLQAVDPDGDRTLRYRLVRGPLGMRVDSISGLIQWTPEADQSGTHQVEVAVSDPQGDSSSLRFQLAVNVDSAPPASN